MTLNASQFESLVCGFYRYNNNKTFPTDISGLCYKFYHTVFYEATKGYNLTFINGNTAKKTRQDYYWSTFALANEINSSDYEQIDIEIKWTKCVKSFYMGYITNSIENSITNWNEHLGSYNQRYSVAYWVYNRLYYFKQYKNGHDRILQYRANRNFKQNDTFQLSFNFNTDQLIIYHNNIKAEILPLYGAKTIIPAFSLAYDNEEIHVEIINNVQRQNK